MMAHMVLSSWVAERLVQLQCISRTAGLHGCAGAQYSIVTYADSWAMNMQIPGQYTILPAK